MRAHEFRGQLLGEFRNFAQVFCQDARLIVVEGVDVDGRVLFVRRNVLHLALVDRLRALNGFPERPAAGEIVADHAPGHAHLLGLDDAVVGGDDSRARRDIHARCARAHGIKEERVQHMDPLGDDDGLPASLHRRVASGFVGLKIIPRHLRRLAPAEFVNSI